MPFYRQPMVVATTLAVISLSAWNVRADEAAREGTNAPQPVRLSFLQDPLDPEDEILPVEPRTPADRFSERRRDPFADLSSGRGYRSRPPTRLASVPNMFGDFFGSSGDLLIQPQSRVVKSIWTDVGPAPFHVFNSNGQLGAGTDPAAGIFGRMANGQILFRSIAPGEDNSRDGINDTFQISEPVGSVPPNLPGTVTYLGGKAVYLGPGDNFFDKNNPPNDLNQADGTSDRDWGLLFEHRFDPHPVVVPVAGGGSAAIRRVRLSENNSPEPRDRLIFNYSFFSDVIGNLGDVKRYIVGAEKTFFQGSASIELRIPFASTLSSDQVFDSPTLSNTEFGNLGLVYKHILYENGFGVLSGGMGLTLPTADDSRVLLTDGRPILLLENEAVHLLPFLGHIHRSGDFFVQTFVQLDLDTNGNPVAADFTGNQLQSLGVLQDSTLLFLDLGAGYTTYSNPGSSGVTRITPMAELHYVSPLQDADAATDGTITLTSIQNRFDMINATLGVDFLFRDHLHVRPAFTMPLRVNDREFDYEVQLQVNSMF